MEPFDHNRVLNGIAREHLKPLGFKQRGSTRTWIADENFWVIVVEFQASQWSRGSYLNVAPMWLWKPTPTTKVFPDASGRTTPFADQFIAAEDEAGFRTAITQLAEHAVARVGELRDAITSYSSAARFAAKPTLWMHPKYPDLNSAIAAGLAAEWTTSERELNAYLDRMAPRDDDNLEAVNQLAASTRTQRFAETVNGWIDAERAALKLASRT